jgi:CubicO group peptidase (beta-lactamase class C family)
MTLLKRLLVNRIVDQSPCFYCLVSVLLGIFVFLPQTANAACPVDRSQLEPVIQKRIDDTLASIETSGVIPGAVVVAVFEGKPVVCTAFGYANLEHEVKITTKSLFDMGSVSKQFTALAILMLKQDGKLDLDDPVRDHLDWFPEFEQEIRIQHLVHHSSGLKDIFAQLVLTGRSYLDAYWASNARHLLERQLTLNHLPGDEYSYSNTGYFAMAQIVEKITGKSLQEFLQEQVFEEPGMQTALLRSSPMQLVPNRVQSYRIRNEEFTPFPSNAAIVGPGFLHLSAEDMQIWASQFGDSDSPIATRKLNDGSENNYAHGLYMGSYRDMPAFTHSGSWLGNTRYQQYLPAQQLTILVATNNSKIKPVDLTHQLTDAILGRGEAVEAATSEVIELSESELEAFVGLYETKQGDIKEFVIRDGQLGFLALPDKQFHSLEAIAPDRFRIPAETKLGS